MVKKNGGGKESYQLGKGSVCASQDQREVDFSHIELCQMLLRMDAVERYPKVEPISRTGLGHY